LGATLRRTKAEIRDEKRQKAREWAAAGVDLEGIARLVRLPPDDVLRLLGLFELNQYARADIRRALWTEWRGEGMTFRQIAARSGVHEYCVLRAVKKAADLNADDDF
jgi:hypothetical protein